MVKIAHALRAAGIRVDMVYGDRGIKGSMKAADRSGARIALVLGDEDLAAGTIAVKDLSNGEQTSVAMEGVVAQIGSILADA